MLRTLHEIAFFALEWQKDLRNGAIFRSNFNQFLSEILPVNYSTSSLEVRVLFYSDSSSLRTILRTPLNILCSVLFFPTPHKVNIFKFVFGVLYCAFIFPCQRLTNNLTIIRPWLGVPVWRYPLSGSRAFTLYHTPAFPAHRVSFYLLLFALKDGVKDGQQLTIFLLFSYYQLNNIINGSNLHDIFSF